MLLPFADAWRTRSAYDRATVDLRSIQTGTVVALVGGRQPLDPKTVARRALAAGTRRLILVVDRQDWSSRTTLETGADAAVLLRAGATGAEDARLVRSMLLSTGAFRIAEPTRRHIMPALRALIGRGSIVARATGRA
jgi:hypothetical protein